MRARSVVHWALAAGWLWASLGLPAPAFAQIDRTLASVEEMLEAGRPEEALELLSGLEPADDPTEARVLLHRSTARFMLGQIELGRQDLDAALRKDGSLRQAWLNRAALDISESRLDRALEALERARELDPKATDNDLNIGAVLVMQGRVDEAHTHLQRYLAGSRASADAWYLVASNYALGGQADQAIEHLVRAIAMDERMRLRSRTDPNFGPLSEVAAFQQALVTDTYRIPAGSHAVYRTYEDRYLAGQGKLLPAVLDALQLLDEPFDRLIEVAPDWALIWGEMRIKVRNDTREGGRVELTAPRSKFAEADWKARASRLFAEIAVQLAKR